MSDWLELELAHRLAPVEAPPALTLQAVCRPAPRRSFHLAPMLATAAAAAMLLLVAPHRGSSPVEINRYFRSDAGIDLPIPAKTKLRIERARVIGEGDARMASVTFRTENRANTVLIARAAAVRGPAWRVHPDGLAIASTDAHLACVLCHSDL